MVSGLKRLLPALLAGRFEQLDLRWTVFKIRSLHAEQAYRHALLPVVQKQASNFFINFGVELRGLLERVSAGERGEVFVTQFELERAGKISAFAQAAAYHFAQAHERGLQAVELGGVFVVSVFVADRLGIGVFGAGRVEPSSGVLTDGLSG